MSSFNVGDNVYILEKIIDTNDKITLLICKDKICSIKMNDESNIVYGFDESNIIVTGDSLFLTLAAVITEIKSNYNISELTFKSDIGNIIYVISKRVIPSFNSEMIIVNKIPLYKIELELEKENNQIVDIHKYYHVLNINDIKYDNNKVYISLNDINLNTLFN